MKRLTRAVQLLAVLIPAATRVPSVGVLPLHAIGRKRLPDGSDDGSSMKPKTFHTSARRVAAYMSLMALFSAMPSRAQIVGTCGHFDDTRLLEANNVAAAIPGSGGLFYDYPAWYRYNQHFEAPRFSGLNLAWHTDFWIAGKANGFLKMVYAAGSTRSELWAGPLDENGNPPADCSEFDRMYSVFRSDVDEYETTGVAIPDLADWPTGLGAPTLDASGNPIDVMHLPVAERSIRTIDLSAGERPDLQGDQAIWWLMNDMGNVHGISQTAPLGIEVHGLAYAVASTQPAIANTTFHHYRIFNRSQSRLDSIYIAFRFDGDIGSTSDDFFGSDSLLSMGYFYNADNEDNDYGLSPPAIGLTLMQGPLADSDGLDNNRNGLTDEAGERAHLAYISDETDDILDPRSAEDRYDRMKGRWPGGIRITEWGLGYEGLGRPVNYLYPGDPVKGEFWSMVNSDGQGNPRWTKAQIFVFSVGPIAIEPGDDVDLTFAYVWARGENNLDSITKLREAVTEVRTAFDHGFAHVPKGEGPTDTVRPIAPSDGASDQPIEPTLHWLPTESTDAYEVEVWSPDTTITKRPTEARMQLTDLSPGLTYRWRVRALNTHGRAPWSGESSFSTGELSFEERYAVFSAFQLTHNAAGPIDPPEIASTEYLNDGFPRLPCHDDPERLCGSPYYNRDEEQYHSAWIVHAGGAENRFGPVTDSLSFLGRVTRNGKTLAAIGRDAFEMRLTAEGGKALLRGTSKMIDVPFELWNIGEDTPDDPSDDYRMIPELCESACGAGWEDGVFDFAGRFGDSYYLRGPYTDQITWLEPDDTKPGQAGYDAFVAGTAAPGKAVLHDMVLIHFRYIDPEPPYDFSLPETGSIFRISTSRDPAPILSAPGIGQEMLLEPVYFAWQSPHPDLRRFQVAETASFDRPLVDSLLTTYTFEWTPPATGTYYWRVGDIRSPWSEVGTFEIVDEPPEEPEETYPDEFAVSTYPNPVHDSGTMRIDLPEARPVRIEIFDLLGRRVMSVLDGPLGPGTHFLSLATTSMASGLYLYRVEAGRDRLTGKVIVVR